MACMDDTSGFLRMSCQKKKIIIRLLLLVPEGKKVLNNSIKRTLWCHIGFTGWRFAAIKSNGLCSGLCLKAANVTNFQLKQWSDFLFTCAIEFTDKYASYVTH